MTALRKVPIMVLGVANILALAVLMMLPPSLASASGIDDCDEENMDGGCDCINESIPPWLPVGCYPNFGDEFLCIDGSECG